MVFAWLCAARIPGLRRSPLLYLAIGEDHDEEVEQEQQEAEDADAAYDIAVTDEECLAISEADGFMKRLFLPPRCLPEDFA